MIVCATATTDACLSIIIRKDHNNCNITSVYILSERSVAISNVWAFYLSVFVAVALAEIEMGIFCSSDSIRI